MEEDIKRRLYRVIPSSSIHMVEFLSLMDIKYSSDIPTACVTCTSRPTLLLNKDFIDTYCETDEHLFMLVMHELYHVILGHTKLFKGHTLIDNVAFDAIINAILCRTYDDPEYVSFFESINKDNVFPGCILRPIGKDTPKEFSSLLNSLYSSNKGTYYEVYETIIDELKKNNNLVEFILVGNHLDNSEDDISNPILKKIVEDIVSKWPRVLLIKGRDLGVELKIKKTELENPKLVNKKKMLKLLKRAGVINGNLDTNKKGFIKGNEIGESFIPNYKDRTYLVKNNIYQNVLIYQKEYEMDLVRNVPGKTYVYLDVSGSVMNSLKDMMPLLLKPLKNNECKVFAFSTKVEELSYKNLKNGEYKTTGGTEINCVFDHYFSIKKKDRGNKILILTDGWTGRPSSRNIELINENKTQIFCGYFGLFNEEELKDIIKFKEVFN